MEENTSKHIESIFNFSVLAVILIGLYFTTWVNYLLFHTLAEGFSVVVAFSFFIISWNSKKYIQNSYLLLIGIAYLFISFIDILHTLSYKGMPIFTDYDYYANQLWIGARYMESITLIMAFIFLGDDKKNQAKLCFCHLCCDHGHSNLKYILFKNISRMFYRRDRINAF